MTDGIIKITKYPPPTGFLGPNARRTNSHVYQIFSSTGVKLIGGTFGDNTDRAIDFATKRAAKKGIVNPHIVFNDTTVSA